MSDTYIQLGFQYSLSRWYTGRFNKEPSFFERVDLPAQQEPIIMIFCMLKVYHGFNRPMSHMSDSLLQEAKEARVGE